MFTSAQKPKLIVFCSLAALQDEYTVELQKKLDKSVLLKKNTLTDALLDGKNHTTDAYQLVKKNMYAALNQMAVDQLKDGNTVILHGMYGDKLSQPGTIEYIMPASDAYDVRIIYLHCSGEKHQAIIAARGSDRDNDKKGEKYNPYRVEHIRNHLRELSKVSNVLLVDIEKNNFAENMQIILNYVQNPAPSIQIVATRDDAEQQLQNLTTEDALGGMQTFKKLLGDINGLSFAEDNTELKPAKKLITPLYALGLGLGAGVLSLAVFCSMSKSSSDSSARLSPKL